MGTTINSVDSITGIGITPSVQKQTDKAMHDFTQVLNDVAGKNKVDVNNIDNVKTKSTEMDKPATNEYKKAEDVKQEESISENTDTKFNNQSDKTVAEDENAVINDTEENVSEDIKVDIDENTELPVNVLDEKSVDDEIVIAKPVDENSTEKLNEAEIVNALEMILQQIRQVLGVDDIQIAESVQNLEIETVDLINPDKMAQLVADLSGEESTVGLIANEELYNSMQELTKTADNILNELVQKTGLTKENILSDYDIPLETVVDIASLTTEEAIDITEMIDLTDETVVDEKIINHMAEDIVANINQTKDEVQTIVESKKQPEIKEVKETKSENEVKIEVYKENETKVEANKTDDSTKHDSKDSKSDKKDFISNSQTQTIETKFEDIEALTADKDAILDSKANTESIMRQLADFVKINSGKEITEMELQLHPASLGNVNVQLATKGGVVTAQFTTENETVRAAIEAQATQLKLELEEQGVKIEAIEVTVSSHEMEKNLDEGNQNNNQERQNNKSSKIGGIRKGSINLRAFESEGELAEEMQNADDATRVAMEMMRMHGNTMSLLA